MRWSSRCRWSRWSCWCRRHRHCCRPAFLDRTVARTSPSQHQIPIS
jgi:hypothetical protein